MGKKYLILITLFVGCGAAKIGDQSSQSYSVIPDDRLTTIKQALPQKIAYAKLDGILKSNETFWYDHKSMKPAYQASIRQSPPYGANSNDRWFDTIADSVKPVARVFYDEQKRNFKFPFATTAGTDLSTNIQVVNFLHLPKVNGRRLPVAVKQDNIRFGSSSFTSNSWGWVFPKGAIVGEILLIKGSNGRLLPTEIRTRQRFANDWAVNVYRPFPTAVHLASRIKQVKSDWQSSSQIVTLINHLENQNTLTTLSREAKGMPGVFKESGHHDILPAIGDENLVALLLRTTPFVSAYDLPWKKSAQGTAFAPSTKEAVSIVPNHYEAGLIAVNEKSCARCHSETARHLSNFDQRYGSIVLYGEMWGRDGIFSFQPFDADRFSRFWNINSRDNRTIDRKLVDQGIVEFFNRDKHGQALYPAKESGGVGKGYN